MGRTGAVGLFVIELAGRAEAMGRGPEAGSGRLEPGRTRVQTSLTTTLDALATPRPLHARNPRRGGLLDLWAIGSMVFNPLLTQAFVVV